MMLKINVLRLVCTISIFILIILTFLWEWKLFPIREGGSWLALKALPLCLPLSGILKGKVYAYQVSSMLILFYFAEGIVRVISDLHIHTRVLALLEIILSLIFFISCVLYIRLCIKHN